MQQPCGNIFPNLHQVKNNVISLEILHVPFDSFVGKAISVDDNMVWVGMMFCFIGNQHLVKDFFESGFINFFSILSNAGGIITNQISSSVQTD